MLFTKEEKRKFLEQIDLFVLDMDGTFYLGDKILEGSLTFLQKVKEAGKDYIFFTNNSSKSPDNYIHKLAAMDCHIKRNQIMTSGDVTIEFLKRNRTGQTVYLVGTPALEKSFQEAGIPLVKEKPDIVVIGFDMTLTYEKLERACTFIRDGAEFLATHPDINCPTEDGFIPDCGAMCALISLSTAKEPKYLGKPFKETMEMVLAGTGYARDKVAFVGDRIYTDVATGVKNGARGILVLSGETRPEDVAGSEVQPDAVFNSIGEMAEYL